MTMKMTTDFNLKDIIGKDTRIKFIQNKLNDLKEKPNFLIDNGIQEDYKIYKASLDEATQKKTHYLFIATNYDEYLKL